MGGAAQDKRRVNRAETLAKLPAKERNLEVCAARNFRADSYQSQADVQSLLDALEALDLLLPVRRLADAVDVVEKGLLDIVLGLALNLVR
jgi:hypothetical protein